MPLKGRVKLCYENIQKKKYQVIEWNKGKGNGSSSSSFMTSNDVDNLSSIMQRIQHDIQHAKETDTEPPTNEQFTQFYRLSLGLHKESSMHKTMPNGKTYYIDLFEQII